MHELNVVNILLGLVLAGVGWHVRTLHQRQHVQADKITKLEVLVAGQYVTRADYRRTTDEMRAEHQRTSDAMFALLRRIEDKLDKKADK